MLKKLVLMLITCLIALHFFNWMTKATVSFEQVLDGIICLVLYLAHVHLEHFLSLFPILTTWFVWLDEWLLTVDSYNLSNHFQFQVSTCFCSNSVVCVPTLMILHSLCYDWNSVYFVFFANSKKVRANFFGVWRNVLAPSTLVILKRLLSVVDNGKVVVSVLVLEVTKLYTWKI